MKQTNRKVAGIVAMSMTVWSGCNSAMPGGLAGFSGMTGQRVPPPGTGTYSSPDKYYRGPESVAVPNPAYPNSLVASLPVGSGVATAGYTSPVQPSTPHSQFTPSEAAPSQFAPTNSSNNAAAEVRSKLRGMPAIDLTNAAQDLNVPPPVYRGQTPVAAPDEDRHAKNTDFQSTKPHSQNSKPSTPVVNSQLTWQTPAVH